MKRLFYILVILFLASFNAFSQGITQVWYDMPDSISGYMSRLNRVELVDFYRMGGDAYVKNKLEGKSRIETLTKEFIKVRMSDALVIQMRLLCSDGRDSIVCLVRTYSVPAEESVVELYSKDWERLATIDISKEELIEKPDTMSEERYEELKPFLLPRMISACLDENSDELTITRSIPFSNPDNKEELKALVLQRKLKWNNKTFN